MNNSIDYAKEEQTGLAPLKDGTQVGNGILQALLKDGVVNAPISLENVV